MPGSGGVGPLIDRLPERFTGNPNRVKARFRLHIGRVRRDVVVSEGDCDVVKVNGQRPDVEIRTDPATWAAIDAGDLSGIEAFADRRLTVRGSITRSLFFEPLFERPHGRGLRYEMRCVNVPGASISMLVAGRASAPPLFLLHGLGGTNSSWLPALPQLARRHRVFAVDFPGFGGSSKPYGRYDAAWFGRHMFNLMDEIGLDTASLAGNSMGGRVAMEMALTAPDRVAAIACLCPATAFSHRPFHLLARLSRPEWGLAALRLPRSNLIEGLRQMFADPTRLEDEWFEAAVDDFLHIWRNPRARYAFFAAARRIYLEEPHGETGLWSRLQTMTTPSLFVFGTHDPLITARFGARVQKALPRAQVEIWPDSGHVPQLEHPERTGRLLTRFFAAATASTRKAG